MRSQALRENLHLREKNDENLHVMVFMGLGFSVTISSLTCLHICGDGRSDSPG